MGSSREIIRLDEQAGPGDDPVRFQALDPLVDGRAGDAAFTGNLQERHPRVLDEEGQDFLIDLVDVISCHGISGLLFKTNHHKSKKFF